MDGEFGHEKEETVSTTAIQSKNTPGSKKQRPAETRIMNEHLEVT